ncbi:helix-turn-helix transcriptional regulator [Blautia hydrogenotrophica]|uniref:helix-turn-helix domain-containing protein n=1 Tax=Blautia hydrogenotrophica TaxID=53443 RepID=UPI002942357C|nr:helix-turn-helix transcriptional regulator [Blautia hydrogenotrophica]
MSIGSRIKERREQLHLSRNELANKINVTPSAIANYENEISLPKFEIMYKLFDALDCDANYLHQDEMKNLKYKDKPTPEEFENIVKKYRDLDDHGKKMVDFTLEEEYERSKKLKEARIVQMPSHLQLNAAHDINATEEQRIHADSIMEDDSEWE